MADKQSVTPKRDLLSIRNFVLLIWKNMQNFLNLYFVECKTNILAFQEYTLAFRLIAWWRNVPEAEGSENGELSDAKWSENLWWIVCILIDL